MAKVGTEGIMTVSSSNNSEDSGYGNGFLDDATTSSESSGSYEDTCEFEGPSQRRGSLSKCHYKCSLETYDISGNCIEIISPRTFQYYKNYLIELNLSKNNISVLPDNICELKNLKVLNISENKFSSIPVSWKVLHKLKVLNVSINLLTEFPQCLELGMPRLTSIDLSCNQISDFTSLPMCLPFLQKLNLSHNLLFTLPVWLLSDMCKSLKELDLSFNFCFDDPKIATNIYLAKHFKISSLKTLKNLNISNIGTKLDMISCISHFESLQSVFMGSVSGKECTYNSFWEISMDLFSNPLNITELHIPRVGLAGLPTEFGKLQNLRVLDLSDNNLDWLPESFGKLKSLMELCLSNCNLAYLPDSFDQLSCITKLLLNCNKLSDVRSQLAGLTSLQWLDLYDNLLDDFPIAPELLTSQLEGIDVEANYINVEENNTLEESSKLVYYQLQTNLRNSDPVYASRYGGCKTINVCSECDSSEYSFKKKSDLSDDDESSLLYPNNEDQVPCQCNDVEENWDDDSNFSDDFFDPNLVDRYSLPPGQFKFGWTPSIRYRECVVPTSQKVSGFVYIPGQLHTKTSRRRRVKVNDLYVFEGQFDDLSTLVQFHSVLSIPMPLHHLSPSLLSELTESEESDAESDTLWGMLKQSFMFIRHPLGPTRKACRLCSVYEDCYHHGIWIRF